MDNDEEKPNVEIKENGKKSASEAFYEEFGLFGSPRLQYLKKKEAFLKEFLFPENWGRKGSRKRVVAIDTVVKYLEDIKKLVEAYPSHLSGVESENVDLFFSHDRKTGIMRLPIPSDVATLDKLAEITLRGDKSADVRFAKLLTGFKTFRDRASEFYQWSEIDRVNNFEDYRPNRPPRSRNGFWSRTEDSQIGDQSVIKDDEDDVPTEKVENDPSKNFENKLKSEQYVLKRLHRKIFSRIEYQKPASLAFSIYRSRVKRFIKRYKTVLPREEISALEGKLKETEAAVEQSSKDNVLGKFFEQPKPPAVPDLPSQSWFSQAVLEMTKSETTELKTSIAKGDQLKLPLSTALAIASMLEGSNVNEDDIYEMGIRFARAIIEKGDMEERFENENDRPDEFFDAQAKQKGNSGSETVQEIFLPDVPIEEPFGHEVSDSDPVPESIDKDIEVRLKRLQIFNEIWLSEEKPCNSSSKMQSPPSTESKLYDVPTEAPVTHGEAEPIFSTKEDQDSFNEWYYNHLKVSAKHCIKDEPIARTKAPLTATLATNDVSQQSICPAPSMENILSVTDSKEVHTNNTPLVWQVDLNIVIVLMMTMIKLLNPSFMKPPFPILPTPPACMHTSSPPSSPVQPDVCDSPACPVTSTISHLHTESEPVTCFDTSSWGLGKLECKKKQNWSSILNNNTECVVLKVM